VLFIPCVPFICFGISLIAWAVASLCCERPSNAWFAVWFGISMGTITAVHISTAVYLWRRERKQQRAHAAEIATATAERQRTTLH
jgi:hypothetical protein